MTSNDPTRLALCPLRVGFIAKVPLSPLGIPTGRPNCEVTGTSDGHRTAGLVSPCCCLGVWTNREHLSHGGGQLRSPHLHRHSRNARSTPNNEAANKLICRLIIKIYLFFYFLGAVHIVRSLCPYTTWDVIEMAHGSRVLIINFPRSMSQGRQQIPLWCHLFFLSFFLSFLIE